MSNRAKKLKTEVRGGQCEDNIRNASKVKKRIPLKKILKSEIELKKEQKKPTKSKTRVKLDEEPVPKKKKLKNPGGKFCKKNVADSKKDFAFNWSDEEYLAEVENLHIPTARNVIQLFREENTIPFIARYRSDVTGNLNPDKLRKIKETYEYIQLLHTKAQRLVQRVLSEEANPSELILCIQTAKTLEELEFIGSSFKKNSKRSLAECARQLGLEVPAKSILEEKSTVNLKSLVDPEVPGLQNIEDVKLGIQHIIADIISKNSEVHAVLEKIYSSHDILLKSKFRECKNENDKVLSKYHLYGDFSQALTSIRPHQTLAINRGEAANELVVKIVIPDFLWLPLKTFCHKKWSISGDKNELRSHLLRDSVNDAVKRLLVPLAVRRIRAKLKAEAEYEALRIFGSNLRQLLMTPPCSGHVVMGIDPGFKHGCKVAVVSAMGELIVHEIVFLNDTVRTRKKLKNLVLNYECDIIALGNGTGCRETEALLSDCIRRGIFEPLKVSYTIINEQGISIYSCSSAAEEEFADMDPKIISAISLARRLQNPLSELVKVEPEHLGVGMYQHDMTKKKLVTTLDDTVSECVSFVGVDINSASLYLLKRVAGLSTAKAQEIIKYRTENCSFKCREDLKKVKGIKSKTFQQCAGFIRVIPSTARCTKHTLCKNDFNPLDETCIHPESYEVVLKIMKLFGLNLNQLGSEEFVKRVTAQSTLLSLDALAKIVNCSVLSLTFIIDTLMKPKDFDLRSLSSGPIFHNGVKKLEELFPGQILEGIVRNVVTFGAFVDIGVGSNGLIHTSQMGNNVLKLNDRVKVVILSIVLTAQRIQLKLVSVLK